ncbi:MAG: hypothetical protein JWN01_408 [Patescibacteria group bacterium]|nr:hypothetical protein [Patescibacteria group bacterium]
MSGYEQFVAGLLTEASLIWVYESLWVPIRRPTSLPDPRIKRRRPRHILCNDFYLPERGIIIEIYSGYSEQGWAKKYRHLERMMAHHRIPFLLLDVQDWELLKKNPRLLSRWIDQRITTA